MTDEDHIHDACILREAMIMEEDTINKYQRFLHELKTDDAKEIMKHIIAEEMRHSGEFHQGITEYCNMYAREFHLGVLESIAVFEKDDRDLTPLI